MTDAKPFPKSAQLARGERRHKRKIASPQYLYAALGLAWLVVMLGMVAAIRQASR